MDGLVQYQCTSVQIFQWPFHSHAFSSPNHMGFPHPVTGLTVIPKYFRAFGKYYLSATERPLVRSTTTMELEYRIVSLLAPWPRPIWAQTVRPCEWKEFKRRTKQTPTHEIVVET